MAVDQLQPGVVDERLVCLDGALKLADRRGLGVQLLFGDGVLPEEHLVTRRSILALLSCAWSRASCPSACDSCSSNGRGSISARTSAWCTNWPSRKATLINWPSTRLFPVTVLKGVTDPSPFRYTEMSPFRAAAASTGTLWTTDFAAPCAARDWLFSRPLRSRYAPQLRIASSISQRHHRRVDRGFLVGCFDSCCKSTSLGSETAATLMSMIHVSWKEFCLRKMHRMKPPMNTDPVHRWFRSCFCLQSGPSFATGGLVGAVFGSKRTQNCRYPPTRLDRPQPLALCKLVARSR